MSTVLARERKTRTSSHERRMTFRWTWSVAVDELCMVVTEISIYAVSDVVGFGIVVSRCCHRPGRYRT
jgi:hypothetical protein